MIRKLAVGLAIGVAGLLGTATTTLIVVGVPKPPTLETEDVGRVAWAPVLRVLSQYVRATRSASAAAWLPGDRGLLIRGSYRVLDRRLFHLPGPGQVRTRLAGIPRNATGPHTSPGREYGIFSWDSDGTEEFQLYRWDFGSSVPVRLTDGRERAAFGAFEPRGTRYAFQSNRRNGADMDIYVADPRDPGSATMVLEATGNWGVLDWSPTGAVLLVAHVLSNVSSELFLLDLASGSLEPLMDREPGPVGHRGAQWAADAETLYLISDRDTEFHHLRRLDLATGAEDVLTDDIGWDVTSMDESADGSQLVIVVNEDGRSVVYLYDVRADDLERLDLFETGLTESVTLHPERPWLALTHSDPTGRSRAYVYDIAKRELKLWAGPELSAGEVPAAQLIRYPTFDTVDGKPRQISAFVYPGVGEGPRPVVIDIHGGPEAQARLTSGYAAGQRSGLTRITPNVRGSTGYGKTFAALDDGVLREDAVRDIGALLDWIEQDPSLDERRVAVTGGSYGGYMSLASLVHFGDRIRCGVDVVGISHFVTFLENTADYRRDLRRAEYGDERDPEMRRFLESISPLTNADRIVSPLMIVQGANDPRVPVSESRQMVARVRGNDQQVRYIEGENEGHGFRSPWNAFYARAAQNEMIRECLRG